MKERRDTALSCARDTFSGYIKSRVMQLAKEDRNVFFLLLLSLNIPTSNTTLLKDILA